MLIRPGQYFDLFIANLLAQPTGHWHGESVGKYLTTQGADSAQIVRRLAGVPNDKIKLFLVPHYDQ